MNRNIQRSFLAAMIAMTFAAGSAIAARDPGTQSPTSTSTPPSSYQTATPPSSSAANSSAATSASMASSTAQEKFSQLDVNTDGMIDKQEASASTALKAEFSRLDANKDGKLSLDEFSAAKNLATIKVDKPASSSKKGY